MKIMIATLLLANTLSADWYDRKAEGWFYFEEPEKKKETPKEEPPSPPAPTALEQLSAMRQELENILAEAILNPTEENLHSYMAKQKQAAAQASRFSHQWAKTLLAYPDLDAALSGRPITRYGIKVYNTERSDKIKSMIKELSQNYVLVFFYEGNSRVSQAQSTIVTEFAKRSGFNLVSLTVDGTPLENLPHSDSGSEIASKMGIKNFPSLYLFNPETSEAVPIAYGIATLDVLERNVELQFDTEAKND